MFMDGGVARAVDQVVADGVAYFSAAGVRGEIILRKPVCSFPGCCHFRMVGDCTISTPGPGVDVTQKEVVPAGHGFSCGFPVGRSLLHLGTG